MREFEKKIKYKFKDINNLAKVFCVKKVKNNGDGNNHDKYENDGLAKAGDAIINFVFTTKFYCEKIDRKGKLTDAKKLYLSNASFRKLVREEK